MQLNSALFLNVVKIEREEDLESVFTFVQISGKCWCFVSTLY